MTDRIKDPWGERTPFGRDGDWPERVDLHLGDGLSEDDVDGWFRSASVLHSNGDALDIAVKDDRIVGVRGLATDRVNRGRLDPKDLYGWQANNSGDRLTKPLVRDENGELVEASWDEAMGRIVERSKKLLDEKGPLSLGFYTTGQLFLEEYYTLGVIGKAGLGTPHMDGNTRLCTATSAQAMKESFGSDGQPGSYTDIDHTDTIVLFGHNVAETQAVLWMRMLDRLEGSNPPKLIVVDPRPTVPARRADVHLAIKNGTNVALMNALLHEIIGGGWIDHDYIEDHTLGFEKLRETVSEYPPERAADVCGVQADDIREAARIIGESERLLSTVLEGFYQAPQATAAACQVNNLHLLRGMLGKPGCGVLQMNGQPTAQNTRECGADGDLPAFRNWDNDRHIEELAALWNVEKIQIPSWAPPSHAMQIWRFCEQGSINFLWISGTNPAVSMPESGRIRRILEREDLFVIVQDPFLTETAQFADVILPPAIWGEKTGTFTNADRTVHLSDKAVEPPGEARSDLDIFLDYARRMDLRDRDGNPLIKWDNSESAFEAWRECTRGRLCDYTGITYGKLRSGSGIQWPCNEDHPDGTERLYEDAHFSTYVDVAETFGHDLLTGAVNSESDYRAIAPEGRAFLKPIEYQAPVEDTREEYPFSYTTGRTLYHFHTRTKTARAPELQAAAPEAWMEMNHLDAREMDIAEGDLVEIESPRGRVELPARLTEIARGVVFAPFHYGYFDRKGGREPNGEAPRAANELTVSAWDPVSKQPIFKSAAVRLKKLSSGDGSSPAPTITASAPTSNGVPETVGGKDAEDSESVRRTEERGS